MRIRTCINCGQRLPAEAPHQRYCDGCRPVSVRKLACENSRRHRERYKAARLAALVLEDRTRCRHCGRPLAKPAPLALEFPKPAERVKWFCDRACHRAHRESGRSF